MFIVWGKKKTVRNLGYVADLCLMCRGPQVFRVRRIGLAPHVYYVPIGRGSLLGHERTCQACGTRLGAAPDTYASISRRRLALPELTSTTFPNLTTARREWFDLDEKIRRSPGSLTAEQRLSLIAAPFMVAAQQVELRFKSLHIDIPLGCAMLGTAVGGTVVGMIANSIDRNAIVPAVAITVMAGIGVIVWQAIASQRRYVNRRVLPILANALRPLKPTDAELQRIVDQLKQQKTRLGKKLDLKELVAQMHGLRFG